ncbi:MAG TPA: endonuclease III [Dissulfurispiraceae bacterium]|nr:endonuclease III [Dissulfurispiraceae bacterium]
MENKKRVAEMVKRLKKLYPDPHSCLLHSNPFELLVATILSAQTTDSHVNKVTAGLFRKYRSVEDYAITPLPQLQKDLNSVNFYNNKAKNIQNAAKLILAEFGGTVPQSMDDLVRLPGVARKTANIVLYDAFGACEGIAVDTHVKRLANRLGLTTFDDPVKIERDLMAVVAKKDWGRFAHMLVLHGRAVCPARKPRHDVCVLRDICPSAES